MGGVTVPPAPRLMLVPHARVVPVRNEELATIFDPEFEPSREVVLETAPVPIPTGSAPAGVVRLVAETTDSLTIEADLEAPAILLVTDAYSDGWNARSLLPGRGNTSPMHYQVLPADYCLRGIPLGGGPPRNPPRIPAHHLHSREMGVAGFVVPLSCGSNHMVSTPCFLLCKSGRPQPAACEMTS